MVVNRSRPPGTVIPTFFHEDVAQAIDWLCAAFGFKERFRYGPAEDVAAAQLAAGDGVIMLGMSRAGQSPDWGDAAACQSPRVGEVNVVTSVHVHDVDQHFKRAKEFGARIVHEPETFEFGERQYTAEDLAGYRWAFSQSISDVAPEDWGAALGPGMET